MRKNVNSEHIEGRLFEHDLALKVTGATSKNPNTEYINGKVKIAVDEECMNVITVNFTYVTATTKTGAANKNYATLKKIIESGKTVLEVGKDEATKVKVDTALSLNDFYTDEGLVSAKEHRDGFIEIVNELCNESARNTFKVDMLITNITHTDVDLERDIESPFVTVRGAIFNFRNDLLPVDFRVENPEGIKYFMGMEVSGAEPIYTQVWGKINSLTIKKSIKEESAFGGETAVRIVERNIKNWVITGAKPTPYEFGEENVLTTNEVVAAVQARETMLATKKAEREAYLAQKASNPAQNAFAAAATSSPIAAGGFKF